MIRGPLPVVHCPSLAHLGEDGGERRGVLQDEARGDLDLGGHRRVIYPFLLCGVWRGGWRGGRSHQACGLVGLVWWTVVGVSSENSSSPACLRRNTLRLPNDCWLCGEKADPQPQKLCELGPLLFGEAPHQITTIRPAQPVQGKRSRSRVTESQVLGTYLLPVAWGC